MRIAGKPLLNGSANLRVPSFARPIRSGKKTRGFAKPVKMMRCIRRLLGTGLFGSYGFGQPSERSPPAGGFKSGDRRDGFQYSSKFQKPARTVSSASIVIRRLPLPQGYFFFFAAQYARMRSACCLR
jgi:hypothetical protein